MKLNLKPLVIILKIIISILAIIFIINKIPTSKSDIFLSYKNTTTNPQNYFLLVLVAVLSCLNWIIEGIKWKKLISKIQPITLKKSLTAVVSGITIGIVTPNRIGEYASRVLYLEKGNKLSGLMSTIIGSWSQLLITSILGSISLIYYLITNKLNLTNQTINHLLIVFIVFFNFFSLLCYYFPEVLLSMLSKMRLFVKFKQQMDHIQSYSWIELSQILGLSFCRYVIFSTQFIILLTIFNVNILFLNAIKCISLMYLSVTFLSGLTAFELGIREFFAILYFEQYSDNTLGVIASSLSLWLLNLAIPGLFGIYFLLRTKFINKL